MIDLVAYYAKRKDKALEDGDKRLAASYAHLEEAERIARSGKLPDRESALLSPFEGRGAANRDSSYEKSQVTVESTLA